MSNIWFFFFKGKKTNHLLYFLKRTKRAIARNIKAPPFLSRHVWTLLCFQNPFQGDQKFHPKISWCLPPVQTLPSDVCTSVREVEKSFKSVKCGIKRRITWIKFLSLLEIDSDCASVPGPDFCMKIFLLSLSGASLQKGIGFKKQEIMWDFKQTVQYSFRMLSVFKSTLIYIFRSLWNCTSFKRPSLILGLCSFMSFVPYF